MKNSWRRLGSSNFTLQCPGLFSSISCTSFTSNLSLTLTLLTSSLRALPPPPSALPPPPSASFSSRLVRVIICNCD